MDLSRPWLPWLRRWVPQYEERVPDRLRRPSGHSTDCINETGPDVVIGKQRFTFDECLARYEPRLQRNWTHGTGHVHHARRDRAAKVRRWCPGPTTWASTRHAPARWCAHAECGRAACAMVRAVGSVDQSHVPRREDRASGLVKRRRSEHAMCLGKGGCVEDHA